MLIPMILILWASAQASRAQDMRQQLTAALVFHAPFDGSPDAKRFRGDGKIFTAETLARKQTKPGMQRPHVSLATGQGRYGDCLRFTDKTPQVLCFAGSEVPVADGDSSLTVSFWMKLDPNKDLKPGYCDPIQITQKAWNDAAIFVDFDKDLPRDFRLGVFSDLKAWNPENIAWEKWPVDKRPMVTVKSPPFGADKWTHVALSVEHVNTDKSSATLYLDGRAQGTLSQPLRFSWDKTQTAIMLGIEYIGDLDDLMIFNRSLTAGEVQGLAALDSSL